MRTGMGTSRCQLFELQGYIKTTVESFVDKNEIISPATCRGMCSADIVV